MSQDLMRKTSSNCWDLLIPLAISVGRWRHPNYMATAALRAQPIIIAALGMAARDGWKADQPVDFATLFSRSQVRTTATMLRWRVSSVTIRLVRTLPARAS
ncbi:MAG TPA: hypothetical protein VGN32_05050 [Ktedonobacterales bacterium]|jgi:hypothetical protein|nr:hypothetical protein [Ktedonobacterales bacterium]